MVRRNPRSDRSIGNMPGARQQSSSVHYLLRGKSFRTIRSVPRKADKRGEDAKESDLRHPLRNGSTPDDADGTRVDLADPRIWI